VPVPPAAAIGDWQVKVAVPEVAAKFKSKVPVFCIVITQDELCGFHASEAVKDGDGILKGEEATAGFVWVPDPI